MDNEVNLLIKTLPKFLYEILAKHKNLDNLIEIVLDYGRSPEARFANHTEVFSDYEITENHINLVKKKLQKRLFGCLRLLWTHVSNNLLLVSPSVAGKQKSFSVPQKFNLSVCREISFSKRIIF